MTSISSQYLMQDRSEGVEKLRLIQEKIKRGRGERAWNQL
uniref:Uncharacterized protein n=1 Tax=Rhizophora mucronata TaxID=61149 RepID=A0A2P2Q092_RHIMU